MLRALLFGVLSLGVARLIWTLAQQPVVLDALLEAPTARRFDYDDFGELAAFVQEQVPPGEPVAVLAADSAAYAWIRYLAYPRRIDWLPITRPAALQRALPTGTSFIILPFARVQDDAAPTLAERLRASEVERVLASDGDFALYRVRR